MFPSYPPASAGSHMTLMRTSVIEKGWISTRFNVAVYTPHPIFKKLHVSLRDFLTKWCLYVCVCVCFQEVDLTVINILIRGAYYTQIQMGKNAFGSGRGFKLTGCILFSGNYGYTNNQPYKKNSTVAQKMFSRRKKNGSQFLCSAKLNKKKTPACLPHSRLNCRV